MLCLREPSMGPVFGIKGGGNGGGYAQVVPMEEINLHFNGDFHAVQAAHNLLAAALDASVYHGNALDIDPATITWPRTLDVNDRQLRYTVVGLGGKAHGFPRENSFVIVAASEVMAVFALASDVADLRRRLGNIVVASTHDGKPVTAEDLKVAGALAVIMKDALKPNLVQTLEGQPVMVHAGPFGNIAHANNSIIADRVALKLADYVVTEGGFASDLGFQKFCDIVCRFGGFSPSAAVLVTTVRATKSHGGKPFGDLGIEDLDALRRGIENLRAHVEIVRQYALPCVVSINNFPTDTEAEIELIGRLAVEAGAETVVVNRAFARGGDGAVELAQAVVDACEQPSSFDFLTVGRRPEGADRGDRDAALRRRRCRLPAAGRQGHRSHGRPRLRAGARLHGQDPPLTQSRSTDAQSADRVPAARAWGRAERRCRVRGRALRRHAAHARVRADPGLPQRRRRRAGSHRRPVLEILDDPHDRRRLR